VLKSYLAVTCAALFLSACNQSSEQAAPTPETKPAVTAEQTSASSEVTESQRVNTFFERIFEASVARYPEYLTSLGRKDRADEWNDLSAAYANESMEITKKQLIELQAFDRDKLDKATKLSYDLLLQSMEEQIEDNKWRLYNYPVNQMFGRH
jgi:uncharacterized protein (DUF885 family)